MEEYIGIVKIFAGPFAPRRWAFCEGQILNIALYTPIFSLIGNYYGGNGQTTFALPDLRGRACIGAGQGPGLRNYELAERGGQEAVRLTINQLPAHTHPTNGTLKQYCSTDSGETNNPTEGYPASTGKRANYGTSKNVPIGADNINTGSAGGGQPVSIMQPYLAINYIICLEGVFPSRD